MILYVTRLYDCAKVILSIADKSFVSKMQPLGRYSMYKVYLSEQNGFTVLCAYVDEQSAIDMVKILKSKGEAVFYKFVR